VRHGAPDALYSPAVMTGFVNALGILIFFAQVPHFWSRQPLIVGLFVLTLLIVLWAPRFIKAIPAPLIAIVALTSIPRPPASCCRPSAMKGHERRPAGVHRPDRSPEPDHPADNLAVRPQHRLCRPDGVLADG
jgi:hypothetical protein